MRFLLVFAIVQVFTRCVIGQEIKDKDIWLDVRCDEYYYPENCDLDKINMPTVEDFERCGPAHLPLSIRNYFLSWGGRGITYKENRKAFQRIFIRPRMLVDISDNSLGVTALGEEVAFPIGIAPTAQHKYLHPEGESAMVKAAASMNTIMIVSSIASMRLEDIAASVQGTPTTLWMQTYIFKNRAYTIDIVRRAERSGYKAIVLTVDSNIVPKVSCDAKWDPLISSSRVVNIDPETFATMKIAVITPSDITWLTSITKLPIIAKGILTGEDARRVINAGASAIIVSNHGGRQLDSVPATIDVLPEVVRAVNQMFPPREVYLDGGIRNGFDVYKALARGAKMVFVGRPSVWGLTLKGEAGVREVLTILRDEFNSTMLLAGASDPSRIRFDSGFPSYPSFPGASDPSKIRVDSVFPSFSSFPG